MNETSTNQVLLDHYRRAHTMFRDAVRGCPSEVWRADVLNYARPAGIAYHVVETLDFYFSDLSADEFVWGGRFDVDWESPASDRLPSAEDLLAYLDEVEPKVAAWLECADLSEAETVYPWTGASHLARAIYVLRNTQHHVAELNLALLQLSQSYTEWH